MSHARTRATQHVQEGKTMHSYVRRGLEVALVVGGGILFFAGQASADEGTTGAGSVLGGNQAAVSVVVPVSVTGSSISVVGDSDSSGATAPAAPAAPRVSVGSTSGEDSAAGGNQAPVAVSVPVTVSGNAVSVLGDSSSSGSTATAPAGGSTGSSGSSTSGEDSIAGGNQVAVPVTAPVAVSGNAVSVLGDSSSSGSTTSAPGA